MSIQARVGGVFQNISELRAMLDGTWKPSKSEWVKVSGVWRQRVPANAVLLYDTVSYLSAGEIASALISGSYERIVRGGTPGTLFGATEHNGSGHGYTRFTFASYTHPQFGTKFGTKTVYYIPENSHSHTMVEHATFPLQQDAVDSLHQHSGLGTNRADKVKGFIPVIGCDRINKGCLLASSKAITDAALTLTNYYNYLVGLTKTPGVFTSFEGLGGHYHNGAAPAAGTQWETSLYSNYTSTTFKWENNVELYQYHGHYWTSANAHYMGYNTSYSASKNVIPYIANRDMFFDQIPSGVYLLFLSDTSLEGWDVDTSFNSRSMKMNSSAGGLGGSDTHYHGTTIDAPLIKKYSASNYGSDATPSNSTSYYKTVRAHVHTVTDAHTGLVNHLPPGMNFVIKRKL